MRSIHRRAVMAAFVAPVLSLASVVHAAVPHGLTEQGRVFDQAGSPRNGTVAITFTIYDAASGGHALWSETQTLTLDEGYFSAELGAVVPIPASVWSGAVRHVGITVG